MKNILMSILLLFIVIVISGCSHKSIVKPLDNKTIVDNQKLHYVVAIDGQDLIGKTINQDWDMADLTVVYGDALLLSIKNEFENKFKKVFILNNETANHYYDFKVMYKNNLQFFNCWDRNCNYTSNTSMIVYDRNHNSIYNETIKDNFIHTTPGSALVLAFVTGFTLFISSPVTMPAQAAIRGYELNKDIYNSQNRIVKKIGFTLSDSKIFK